MVDKELYSLPQEDSASICSNDVSLLDEQLNGSSNKVYDFKTEKSIHIPFDSWDPLAPKYKVSFSTIPSAPPFILQLNLKENILKEENYSSKTTENYSGGEILTPDRTYKVVLAGDAAVGKSSFITRICTNEFMPNIASTLGVDYKVKTIYIDNKNLAIQLWDTAGQERFRSITKCYFRRADGVLLLYDVTNEKSFMNVRGWIQDIDDSCFSKIPLILCANKIDIRENFVKTNHTVVSSLDGKRVADESASQFYETSVKTGENVIEAITELTRQMATSEDIAIQTSALKLISDGRKENYKCCNSGKKN